MSTEQRQYESAQFNVLGMTCTDCASRIESMLSELLGVQSFEVRLLSESCVIKFDPILLTSTILIAKINELGFSASLDQAASSDFSKSLALLVSTKQTSISRHGMFYLFFHFFKIYN